MNQFETRINALRLQYKAERVQIQKDSSRAIGHLNTAIGQVTTPEAREALRAEKVRLYEATRRTLEWSKKCYLQQLGTINAEYQAHLAENPSRRAVRRALAIIAAHADGAGLTSLSVPFGDNRIGRVTFE